jgi:dTDP-glucose pyrophosphorylase
MKPTLLVLAAGMGSRYGGLKQMDQFGPSGEAIIDYSIYDAIQAGFGKVVFIVREHFLETFREKFDASMGDKIQLEYVTQELHKLPDNLKYPESRQKPWGTAHAVYMAKDAIKEPFAVINADDFYGRDAFKTIGKYLKEDNSPNYSIVAYYLKNTLSEHGNVNRGVCSSDENGKLIDIVECTKIARGEDGRITYPGQHGNLLELQDDDIVSMNMIGLKPSYFSYCEEDLIEFIRERGHEEKSELYIPKVLDNLIKSNTLSVDVLNTTSNWFGVTYPEDKPMVIQQLNDLIEQGVYPKNLWGN